MRPIPVDVKRVLDQLRIESPETNPWKRLMPWLQDFWSAHTYCRCGKRGADQKVNMPQEYLGARRVFIGQCRWCKTIYWRPAVKTDTWRKWRKWREP